MKKVSIILALKNEILNINSFLFSFGSQLYLNTELIIIDNFSTDGTSSIAAEKADIFMLYGPERLFQRNFGLSLATGDYVLFIDSDQYISPNLISECVQIMESGYDSVFIPEETIGTGFWSKCKKFERDFYIIGDMTVEAARFLTEIFCFQLIFLVIERTMLVGKIGI